MDGTHWARVTTLVAHTAPHLTELCTRCVAELDGVRGASVTVMSMAGARAEPTATGVVGAHIEELQFTLGEGPCLDAVAHGLPVLAADLAAYEYASRWPAFAPAAVACGAAALFAFPLRVGAIRIGVMSLYRDHAGELTDPQLRSALVFADAATLILLSRSANGGPEVDLGRGAVVHQATGMVAVQLAVPLAEALVRLRAHAYAESRPVDEIARDVVERRLRFDELEG
ncbi:MAG TPA: GAF and ANTAR domain-containing protein [Rugosimonospora sp.]|nr:GAF and ANTAR domain-containing protein [Rugosimonospora sp.]